MFRIERGAFWCNLGFFGVILGFPVVVAGGRNGVTAAGFGVHGGSVTGFWAGMKFPVEIHVVLECSS
jgi:hypothetical protein